MVLRLSTSPHGLTAGVSSSEASLGVSLPPPHHVFRVNVDISGDGAVSIRGVSDEGHGWAVTNDTIIAAIDIWRGVRDRVWRVRKHMLSLD